MDKKNKHFDYKFHGFEGRKSEGEENGKVNGDDENGTGKRKGGRKGIPHVQAALKNDNRTYDALKVYWIRRVVGRRYANVGKSKLWATTNKFEKMCVEVLTRILKCSTIDEMLAMHSFYSRKIEG